ncbi:hypothetical protein PTKIN_Ptkin10aG0082900 [Pterospermum kingtungense]
MITPYLINIKLLAQVKNNGTGNDLTPKEMESGRLKCGVENGIAGIPWITNFGSVNDGVSFQDSENFRPGLGLSCTLNEFKKFDTFFSKLIAARREFLMPPERFRFGLVSDRSLMSSLGVEASGTWMAVLYFKGCPDCSKVIKDGDELKSAFMKGDSVVHELEVDGQDFQVGLPANKPSAILFVDRYSDSPEARRKSREALDAFKEVALQYQMLYRTSSQNADHQEKSSLLDFKALELPSEKEGESDDVSPSASEEGPSIGSIDPKSMAHEESESGVLHEEKPKSIAVESSSPYNEDERISSDKSKHFISIETGQLLEGLELDKIKKSGEQELQSEGFKGSFFLCDDNYRLLKSLTGGTTIPSMVLVHPTSGYHFVYPEEATFSYISLSNFFHEYLNGSLVPYQRSAPILHSYRESTTPPFVNHDFHEMDSIPRVTMHTLSKLVFGSNQSNGGNVAHARNEDVVVLFSSNWCGFCQRMELVVREVYRAIKGYMQMLKSGSGKEQAMLNADNSMNNMKHPLIYLMDCTLNDCSLILKSLNQREVYPTMMLFPAQTETAVSYEGDMSVANIIKFIASHGSNSHHLLNEKGLLLTTIEGGRNQGLVQDSSGVTAHEDGTSAKDKFHEVILKNQNPKKVAKYNGGRSRSPISTGSHKATSKVVVGSTLTATDKLVDAIPFDKSRIIIVKADEDTGFVGLIFNKLIRWDSLDELQEGFGFLKEAPLSFGGPVLRRGMPLVALTRRVGENGYLEVLPSIYFLDQFATLANIEELKAGNQSLSDYWFFLGYTGWGWHQLFHEIGEGAWTVSNETKSLDWPSN